MLLSEARWICIDTETTGLDDRVDRVVEIAVCRWQQGRFRVLLSSLVNPDGNRISYSASDVSGITDEMVAGAPKIGELRDEILNILWTADCFVAYNWPFDDAFMFVELGNSWANATNRKPIIDPLVLARELRRREGPLEGIRSCRLSSVARKLKVEASGPIHRASTDCELACLVLQAMLPYVDDELWRVAERCGARG